MDPDMNRYDLEHVVVEHPVMRREDWTTIYWRAWDIYYTRAHGADHARGCRHRGKQMKVMAIMAFKGFPWIEGVHPIQGGILRRKIRSQRRSGLPLEPALLFYPRRFAEASWVSLRWGWLCLSLKAMAWRMIAIPAA